MAKPTLRYPGDRKPDKVGLQKGDIVRLLRPGKSLYSIVRLVDIADENGFAYVYISELDTKNTYTGSYNRGLSQKTLVKDVFMSAVAQRKRAVAAAQNQKTDTA